jgi:hypothetical protein
LRDQCAFALMIRVDAALHCSKVARRGVRDHCGERLEVP